MIIEQKQMLFANVWVATIKTATGLTIRFINQNKQTAIDDAFTALSNVLKLTK